IGCLYITDSIYINNNLLNTTVTAEICEGENYVLPDSSIVSSSGTYITTIPQSSGCDSSVTTLLTQIQVDTVNIVDTISHGGTYILPDGQTVIAPGHYTSVLPSTSGCD